MEGPGSPGEPTTVPACPRPPGAASSATAGPTVVLRSRGAVPAPLFRVTCQQPGPPSRADPGGQEPCPRPLFVPSGSAGAHLDACPVLPHGCPAHRGRADRARRSTPAAGESRLPKADEPAPCIPAWHGLTRDERSRGMNATGEGIIHRSTSINPAHIVHEILSDPCHSYPETPGKNKKPKP